MKNEKYLQKIIEFINQIGIRCEEGIVDQNTFLPGLDIENGVIIYDSLMLENCGDLLHDAGHLAVLKKKDRNSSQNAQVMGDLNDDQAEKAAIAWSWAALQELDIPPAVVFHSDGYRGGSELLIDKFEQKNYIGVDTLERLGMTTEKQSLGSITFPEMNSWLRP